MADKPINLTELIAHAIRDADNRWFNENYTAQARAVISALRGAGFDFAPQEPDEDFIAQCMEEMPFGRMRPEDFVREMYKAMVRKARWTYTVMG